MPINLSQYRGVVGAFNSQFIHIKQHGTFKNAFSQSKMKQTIANEIFTVFTSLSIFLLISSSWTFINLLPNKPKFISLSFVRISYICVLLTFIQHIWLYFIIFNRTGDIEKNPGPKPNCYQTFSICHLNLDSITAHNFLKVSLLRAYITIHSFDVMCPSETYLDSSNSHDDNNLQIPGYNLYRVDHPLNIKRGGVCIYCKISLPLKIKNIQYLQECINFEIKIKGKLCNFITLYRSPNQCLDDFESFINNTELNLDSIMTNNPF